MKHLVLLCILLIGCGKKDSSNNSDSVGASKGNPKTYTEQIIWDAPTVNLDGTLIEDLAGFKVYKGIQSKMYREVYDVKMNVVYNVTDKKGTYYLVVTAYDMSGNESPYSNELILMLPSKLLK